MSIKDEILQDKIGGGTMDYDFLEKEFESFGIDFYDLDFDFNYKFNDIIQELYYKIIRDIYGDDMEIDGEYISIYINYIDSHLYIDSQEMHNREDVEKAFEEYENIHE